MTELLAAWEALPRQRVTDDSVFPAESVQGFSGLSCPLTCWFSFE